MAEENGNFFQTHRQYIISAIANVTLGAVVFKIYYDNPREGYFVFAAYYLLMAYEFYWFFRANWYEAWYGVPAQQHAQLNRSGRANASRKKNKRWKKTKKESGGASKAHPEKESAPETITKTPKPIRPCYPPPLDTDDEKEASDHDDADIIEVELREDWDNSDDDYHEAEEGEMLF